MVSGKTPTKEDRELRDYELVLVLSPQLAEEKQESTLNSISQFITGKEGTVSSIERWGKRRLAYPIKHHADGNYVLAKFKLKPAFDKDLEVSLRISEEVLRHLLVRVDS